LNKYLGCPDEFEIVEEHVLYVKLIQVAFPSRGGLHSLIIPAQFWPRFIIDGEWRIVLSGKYAKHFYTAKYPEKVIKIAGRVFKDTGGKSNSGLVPENEPFALTKFPHCPVGFGKVSENDREIKLACHYQDGTSGAYITVPTILWDRFSTDSEWRNAMIIKYGRIRDLDENTPVNNLKFSEEENRKTGIIPSHEP